MWPLFGMKAGILWAWACSESCNPSVIQASAASQAALWLSAHGHITVTQHLCLWSQHSAMIWRFTTRGECTGNTRGASDYWWLPRATGHLDSSRTHFTEEKLETTAARGATKPDHNNYALNNNDQQVNNERKHFHVLERQAVMCLISQKVQSTSRKYVVTSHHLLAHFFLRAALHIMLMYFCTLIFYFNFSEEF